MVLIFSHIKHLISRRYAGSKIQKVRRFAKNFRHFYRTFLFLNRQRATHTVSPAEIQDDLAKASIENVFVYSDRYGHSDL